VTGSLSPCCGDVGNHLFSDMVVDHPLEPAHSIFGGIPGPPRHNVPNLSAYAYPETVSLVRAKLKMLTGALAMAAPHRLLRLDGSETAQLNPAQQAKTVERAKFSLAAISSSLSD
jgi:hypothetical protein